MVIIASDEHIMYIISITDRPNFLGRVPLLVNSVHNKYKTQRCEPK